MDSEDFPIVETEYGRVKGLKTRSIFNTEYISFRGIPYMKPPLGKLRFREAQSPRNWSEVFDASEEGPSYCMTDYMTGKRDGQENAGTINVFTRNLKPEKLQPVMIWIHGGAFCRGSSKTNLFSPDYLLEKGVIFVAFNYRLGPIGFLSLDDPDLEVPGNVGLKDQVFALKWIQRNIEKFGGDPKQCTLFGESAGGASVNFMCITPQTKNLFQRAIIMSGSVFNKTWSIIPRQNQAERLARLLGWKGKTGNEKEILEFLEDVPASDFEDVMHKLQTDENEFGYGQLLSFGPVIEPYETDNCVVPKDPVEMSREAWTNKIDVIVMVTSLEGIYRANWKEEKAASYLQNPSHFAPLRELNLSPNDPKAVELGTKIKKLFYDEGQEPSVENQLQYLRFASIQHFWHGLYRLVLSRNAHGTGKTFLFRFDVDGELNMFKKLVKKCENIPGACHADDLFYLFNTVYHAPPPPDSPEFSTIQKLVGIFTNFAINGDPNCDEVKNLSIKPYDGSEPVKCVNFTLDDIAEVELPEAEKLKTWNSVYEEANVPLI